MPRSANSIPALVRYDKRVIDFERPNQVSLVVTSGLLAPHTDNAGRSLAYLSTLIQVMAAFLIAGFGNVGAGLILDYVKEWPVFLNVDELFILVPSLLGLKGNLEMTMAARLSTQANLGHMDNGHKLLEMAKGNLALVQCQATVVSLSVAIFASLIKSMTVQSSGVQINLGGSATGGLEPPSPSSLSIANNPLVVGEELNVVVGAAAADQATTSIRELALANIANTSMTTLAATDLLDNKGQQRVISSGYNNSLSLLLAKSTGTTTSLPKTTQPPLPPQKITTTTTGGNLVAQAIANHNEKLSDVGTSGGGGSGGASGGSSLAANSANAASPVVVEKQTVGFDWDNALILCASSLLTANIACFVLGTMMILVIVGSHKVRIDPDNIASPVAASLGDMTTAALLAVIAHSIYHYSENQRLPYLALVITLLFIGMLPVWISVARTNPYTSDVITKGWTPIVIAVFISSCGGFILEYGKRRFNRLPVFQPVINGVGGNLVAVQASRLSTSLHRIGKPGELPADFKLFTSPYEIFASTKRNDINLTTARLLLLMSIPAHFLYFYVIRALEGDNAVPVTKIFLGFYITLAVLQVAVLLYLAQNLVNLLWRCKIDPDNYSTPILTATGDLLGCAFLLVVFVIAYQFNDPYALTVV